MPRMPLLLSGAAKSYAPVIRTYVSLSVRTPRNKSLQKHQANLSVPARSNFSGANVQLLRSPPNPPVIYVQPPHPRAAPNPLHARTHPQYRPPVSAPVSGPMSRPPYVWSLRPALNLARRAAPARPRIQQRGETVSLPRAFLSVRLFTPANGPPPLRSQAPAASARRLQLR